MSTTFQALAIGIQHHQGNRLEAAEQIYRQILAVEPLQADALHLLGVIASQLGQHEVAVEYIRHALALRGDVADFENNLGIALNALGKADEAIACFHRALALNQSHADAYFNLGNALKNQGKLAEAITCFESAIKVKPDFDKAHNNLGVAFMDRGDLSEAVACFRGAIKIRPENAEAHGNLGVAVSAQGDLNEAVVSYRRALELSPANAGLFGNLGNVLLEQGKIEDATYCYINAVRLQADSAQAHCNLGMAMRDQGRFGEANDSFCRALELEPSCAEAHNNLGNVKRDQGKLDEAADCYRRALQHKPDYAEAHYNLGCVVEEIGDFQGAETAFRAALRHNPRLGGAHYQLATLLGKALPREDLVALRLVLQEPSLKDSERAGVHFGLAHVLDCRGDYAEAAAHMDRGNALQLSEWRRRGMEYDQKGYELLVTQIVSICTPEFFKRVHGFGIDTELPILVFGLPRSGTTLIEQILASHSQVFGAGEIKLTRDIWAALGRPGTEVIEGFRELGHETAGRLAAPALERLRNYHPTALRIVDKTPDNFCSLGLLITLFPKAKLIHCRRALRDVAASCWMTRFHEVRWANDHEHIASHFRQYERIMEHWRTTLPAPMLELDYEETVADLESAARKLVAWCGLAWEPACMQFHQANRPVRTASLVQVRQPVYRSSVGRWKNYERLLAPLFTRLENREPVTDKRMTSTTTLSTTRSPSYSW